MDERELTLSVIIPVYHTPDRLLERCIESVRAIRGISKEIILVADGTDLSLKEQPSVKKLLSDRLSHAQYLEIAHQGVSAARNRGIEKANGKWITFVDADDCLSAEFADAFRQLEDDDRTGLVVMDYYIRQKDRSGKHYYLKHETREVPKEAFVEDVLRPQSGAGFAWGKLFRTEWLKRERICFHVGLTVMEDAEFMLQAALRKPVVRYLPVHCYYYCYNPESSVHRFRREYAGQYMAGLEAMRALLSEKGVYERFRDAYDGCALYHLLLIAVNYSFHPQNREKNKIAGFKALVSEPVFREALSNIRLKDFSVTRRAAIICIRLHFYSGVRMIAAVRHRRRGS